MRFTEAVLALSSAAIIFACFEAFTGHSRLGPGVLAIVVIWAAYHVLTAARLLALERRCARNRRATTRFAEQLPATIQRTDDTQTLYAVDVVAASAGGLTLQGRNGSTAPPAGSYDGVLEAGEDRYAFAIDLADLRRGASVRWADGAIRTAFDGYLHQRAIERLGAADRGDRGSLFRSGNDVVEER
jgi:hypothetical protein